MTKTVKIPAINCGHCTRTIEQELIELKGVISVKAEVASKCVTIEWEEPPATWEEIATLLDEIGYSAKN